MFALSFDMNIADLEANYGKPYNPAYYEIKRNIRGYRVEDWSDFTSLIK